MEELHILSGCCRSRQQFKTSTELQRKNREAHKKKKKKKKKKKSP
jgi:hypothetical protein